VNRPLTTALAGCAVLAASARAAPVAERMHPAVVRVMVTESRGSSYGSGALVGVNGQYGLVVTNWHVVRDAAGPILVVFPNGFRSGARVLRTDRDWDLAALMIWRPAVDPIPLANEAPRLGEWLTIAGYGSGWYRTASGRVTQYVAPDTSREFEMVELSAAARNGDSGGPILNRQGQLAGVLFGSASGRTTGSYCGRVRRFLAGVPGSFHGSPLPETPSSTQEQATMLAQTPRNSGTPSEPWRQATSPPAARPEPAATAAIAPPRPPALEKPSPRTPSLGEYSLPSPLPSASWEKPPSRPSVAEEPLRWEDLAGDTWSEQFKTILAAIGLLAIFFHGLRILSSGS